MDMFEKEKKKNRLLKNLSDKLDSMKPRTKFIIVLVITAVVFYARIRAGKMHF